jgi:hypothetical protein
MGVLIDFVGPGKVAPDNQLPSIGTPDLTDSSITNTEDSASTSNLESPLAVSSFFTAVGCYFRPRWD